MRLFVGIDLPDAVKEDLASVVSAARSAAPAAKWVPRDNVHLTLSFLGEVPEERLGGIRDAVAGASASVHGPIPTSLHGAGAFPSVRRARVLWVGLADPDGRLASLASAVARALEPLGFPSERRAWTPHLTLARFRVPADATELVSAEIPASAFPVGAVTLFRSRLGRPAPTYEALARLPLAG